MDTLETIRQFRSMKEPISTVWHVDDQTAVGTLNWRAGKPVLKLVIELDLPKIIGMKKLEHPFLTATEPPREPTIVAHLSDFGLVTLERCFRFSEPHSENFQHGSAFCTLYFQPTRIWLGNPGENDTKPILSVNLMDSRLCGFFQLPGFDSYRASPDEHPELFEVLGNPEELWSFKSDRIEPIRLGKTGFKLCRATTVSRGFSATTGHSYNSASLLTLEPPPDTDRETCEDIVYQLQNLLTVLSFEDFAFEARTFNSETHGPSTLAWELGNCGTSFEPPMSHQILADFSDTKVLQTACDHWFDASEIVRLSRWLFCKAVRETDDGIARFIAVAQALEVLARELSPTAKLVSRSERKDAVRLIQVALQENKINAVYAKRIVELVQNSNATTYANALREMMVPVEHLILPIAKISYPDKVTSLEEFAKLISHTRNAVVHMTTENREELEQAFARVNKLSLLIGFCYAVIQMDMLGLSTDQAHNFLVNNRNLRHGLPNNFLKTLNSR